MVSAIIRGLRLVDGVAAAVAGTARGVMCKRQPQPQQLVQLGHMVRGLSTSMKRSEEEAEEQGKEKKTGGGVAGQKSSAPSTHQRIQGRRRFYKHVSVQPAAEAGTGWEICLDQHVLRTPARSPLTFDSRLLAMAVAAEWDSQDGKKGISPSSMPLMTLSSTTLDQVALDPQTLIANVMQYLATDTICFYADEKEQPELLSTQRELWEPVHRWAEAEFKVKLGTTTTLYDMPKHGHDTMQKVEAAVSSLDPWALSCLQCVTVECKSLLLGLAVLHRHITPLQAFEASQVEETHNINAWGLVEGGHDVDHANAHMMLYAASTLMGLRRADAAAI